MGENPFLQQQHQNWMRKQQTIKSKERQQSMRLNDFDEIIPFSIEAKNNDDEDEKYDIDKPFLEETKGDETFSLVQKWATADPPIVFLNLAYVADIKEPNLKNDLDFQYKNAEN